MTKKIISLFLAVCILFCLSSCGTQKEIAIETTHPYESQTDTTQNTNEITESENSQISSTTEALNETQIQNQVNPTTTTQSAHTHIFSNSTCTSPQICSLCGATTGKPLGHSYAPANCNSPRTCTRCGITSGEALGHSYTNNKCSRCGKVNPDSLPVGLDKVHLIDSQHYQYKSGSFTDSFGNKYTGVHFYNNLYDSGNGREAYSLFNLNGQYAKLTASIVAADNTYANGIYYVNIYVDNVLTYSKKGFTKTTGKIDFSINVKGAQQLCIRVGHEQTLTSYNEQIGIVNAQLSK